MKISPRIIYLSIFVAAFIRIFDGVTDALNFPRGPFSGQLPRLIFHEIFDFSVMVVIFVGCGILISRAMAKQKTAENELRKANYELERHSSELQHFNDQLDAELNAHLKTAKALQESESRIRFLSLQLLAAQEKERREISMELHDEFGQGLASLKQNLWRVLKKMKAEEAEIADEVKEGLKKVDEAIENVRRISRYLSPHTLEYCGASAALRQLINDFSKRNDIPVTLDLIDIDHELPKELHIVLYRIFQEILNNVGKHAFATQLTVRMKNGGERISFLVEDDGIGFDINTTILGSVTGRGLGLAILNERVRMLGGQLDIRSQKGKGTRILFHFPTQDACRN